MNQESVVALESLPKEDRAVWMKYVGEDSADPYSTAPLYRKMKETSNASIK